MSPRGLLIVISAPSGAGKSTLCRELLKNHPDIRRSISVTTRLPRSGEIPDKDYYFISEEQFGKMLGNKELAEWALVHGNYYGTPQKKLEETLTRGEDIILAVDVQGGSQLKKKYPEGIFVFLLPPSWGELEERLRARKTESEEIINQRLRNARKETQHLREYDYAVVNAEFSQAVKEIEAIIIAERCRVKRKLASDPLV